MYLYELMIGGLLFMAGILIGAWMFYKGVQVGVNMATRPESFTMPGESKVQMDDSTI
jgi:hypothetical protein